MPKQLIVLFFNKCSFKYINKNQVELESVLNNTFLVVVVDLVLSFYSMSLQIVFVNVMALQVVFVNVISLQIVFVNVILYCYKCELSSY